MTAIYTEVSPAEFWYCNSHQRQATHILTRWPGDAKHCCKPGLGGVMIPCECVNLTDVAEMVSDGEG